MKINQTWRLSRRNWFALFSGTAAVAALTGCVGYVDGGYVGGAVVAPDPDVVVFGGAYERGHDVHAYSHRGSESRGRDHRWH